MFKIKQWNNCFIPRNRILTCDKRGMYLQLNKLLPIGYWYGCRFRTNLLNPNIVQRLTLLQRAALYKVNSSVQDLRPYRDRLLFKLHKCCKLCIQVITRFYDRTRMHVHALCPVKTSTASFQLHYSENLHIIVKLIKQSYNSIVVIALSTICLNIVFIHLSH